MKTMSALLAICAGNSPVTGEFPAQRPVTRSFEVFFGLRLNKRLNKQSWAWWFDTPSCPLWRHCNGLHRIIGYQANIPAMAARWHAHFCVNMMPVATTSFPMTSCMHAVAGRRQSDNDGLLNSSQLKTSLAWRTYDTSHLTSGREISCEFILVAAL